jgi:hypothetical protein
MLYGANLGKPLEPLQLEDHVRHAADTGGFDLQAYRFQAAPEQLRPPRIVRIGLVQNAIKAPTTAPYAEQRQAIHDAVRGIINAAGAAGVQILCLQEAFHLPFAFCTREREWCEFAEPVEGGASVMLCQELAQQHGMVIVCPILERDVAHAGTIWNTAVVIGHKGNIIGYHRKVEQLYAMQVHQLLLDFAPRGLLSHATLCTHRITSLGWETSTSPRTTWRATRGTRYSKPPLVALLSTSATVATTQ